MSLTSLSDGNISPIVARVAEGWELASAHRPFQRLAIANSKAIESLRINRRGASAFKAGIGHRGLEMLLEQSQARCVPSVIIRTIGGSTQIKAYVGNRTQPQGLPIHHRTVFPAFIGDRECCAPAFAGSITCTVPTSCLFKLQAGLRRII
jgi:hypothetical protein